MSKQRKEEMSEVSTAPSTEGASAIPEALRQAIAAAQGRAIEWPSENQLANAFPVAAEMKKKAAAVKAAEEERRRNPELGDFISGEGVYMGKYRPVGKSGVPLDKIFSVYAAPEDLADGQYKSVSTYKRTVERIAALKNWHGHDGINCASDSDLTALLCGGNYDGQWVIPPGELVDGFDARDNWIQENNLCTLQDTGAFNGTFTEQDVSETYSPDWYWSCTKNVNDSVLVREVRICDGTSSWMGEDDYFHSCRPVRFVEVK